jgi:hypothetical protein
MLIVIYFVTVYILRFFALLMDAMMLLWKILLLFIPLGSDPTYFPALFFPPILIVDSTHLFSPIRVYFSPIRVYFDFSYKYHCTAHNASVLFWTQNRLDQ